MSKKVKEIQKNLKDIADPFIAKHSQRFFKTGKGEYGEGDLFMGIRVPVLRQLAKKYRQVSIQETVPLLKSTFHEERLLALFILVNIFKKAAADDKRVIYELYLANTKCINNWDLVDSSAEHIVGAYLFSRDKKPLYKLAYSNNLWERRIAIMSTFHFIKKSEFSDTLKIAKILLHDDQDLIHKAVGWMLREVGNRDIKIEEEFLIQHYKVMPRTMLRYAIEKFTEDKRQMYLKGEL